MSDTRNPGQYPLPPSTVAASSYTDPCQFKREIEQIFHRCWLPVCPAVDLKAANDYVVWAELGQSVVLIRQDDGSVAAWHNVCQHRGARIVDAPRGTCDKGRFTCPWHGFIYDTTGKLRFAPLRDAFDAERLETLRLPSVRVAEWSGLIWICLSDEAPDLRTYLGGLWDELSFYRMETFDVPHRTELTFNANWKVVVDAFNETWHVAVTHQNTLSHLMLWRDAHLRIIPPHSWMTLPVKGMTEAAGPDADHRVANVCHYLAFPNTFFSCFPTHLQAWSIWPVTETETRLTAWGLVGPTPEGVTEDDWVRRNQRDWDHFCNVSSEDAAVINGWGKVAHSLGQREYMFNEAEGRLTAFHAEVRRRTQPG